MKAAVLAALLSILPAAPIARAALGEPLEGLDGGRLTAEDLEQGATLLVVWATWSPRCRDIGSRIRSLARTWSESARVASVVFQGDAEKIRASLAGASLSMADLQAPVYLDRSGDFSKQHRVTTLPMLLIFRDGELAFRGKLSANPDPVIERVLERNAMDPDS